MEEKMKKFIPLFVQVGLALVAAALYIIVYDVGMPTRDRSPAKQKLNGKKFIRTHSGTVFP
ncbi:MAG: hypothetical protein ACXV5H_12610 [Halobacteriota archaeon]